MFASLFAHMHFKMMETLLPFTKNNSISHFSSQINYIDIYIMNPSDEAVSTYCSVLDGWA